MEFIVALRQLDDEEDVVTLVPEYFILEVPEDVEVQEMKEVLEKSGEADYHKWDWSEYRVLPSDKWANRPWSIDPVKWIEDTHISGETYAPWGEGTTYSCLLDSIHDERRVTLRLPTGLHVALSRAAVNGTTLNSYCVEKLAEAVGYADLEAFEAQRRKPGRPKKVETGN